MSILRGTYLCFYGLLNAKYYFKCRQRTVIKNIFFLFLKCILISFKKKYLPNITFWIFRFNFCKSHGDANQLVRGSVWARDLARRQIGQTFYCHAKIRFTESTISQSPPPSPIYVWWLSNLFTSFDKLFERRKRKAVGKASLEWEGGERVQCGAKKKIA